MCMKKLLYFIIILSVLTSCKTKDTNISTEEEIKTLPGFDNKNVEIEGVIQKQGITTYQYGTHILKGKKTYALTSKKVSLNEYIGKKVKIQGTFISGYPIEGGPQYINVKNIILQ